MSDFSAPLDVRWAGAARVKRKRSRGEIGKGQEPSRVSFSMEIFCSPEAPDEKP